MILTLSKSPKISVEYEKPSPNSEGKNGASMELALGFIRGAQQLQGAFLGFEGGSDDFALGFEKENVDLVLPKFHDNPAHDSFSVVATS